MKIKILILSLIGCMMVCQIQLFSQVVGEHVELQYESSHPYPQKKVSLFNKFFKKAAAPTILHSQEIKHKKDSYISVHFSKLELAEGDKLILRSPDYSRVWEYDQTDNARGAFWSIPIYGNKAILEIVGYNKSSSYGYAIDMIARGYTDAELDVLYPSTKTICNSDQTVEAVCLASVEPIVYEKSRAVARLLLNGVTNCTGWLVGSEGHFFTAGHCIENEIEALNTSVEMMAEGANCSVNCRMNGACPGTIIADYVIYIQSEFTPPSSPGFDYGLHELPDDVKLYGMPSTIPKIIKEFGFLTIRKYGAVPGERIYIPQHPLGHGKRIAMNSDPILDPSGFPTVQSVTPNSVGYFADTDHESSGSPVISYVDHCVIAVHSNGGCPNSGTNGCYLIDQLGEFSPTAICECGGGPDVKINSTGNVWTVDKKMPNNLIIEAGGELTIQSTVAFAAGTKIIIKQKGKLFLIGGLLTACNQEWDGIIIEGKTGVNNLSGDAGQLWMASDATIEKDRTGVSMDPSHLPWSGTKWGGFIFAENSTFRNCGRAVAFMKHGTTANPDNSRFEGVTFDGMESTAVTLWADDGVRFTDCEFINCAQSGILTHRSSIIVNSASGGLAPGSINFKNMPTGIELLDPSMNAINHDGSSITDNKFECDYGAIDIMAVDSKTHNLFQNNIVRGGKDGVRAIGTSNIIVKNNDFESLTGVGVFLLNAGTSLKDNPITENLFMDCKKGSTAIGDNSLTEYTINCFENSKDYDIKVLPMGSGTPSFHPGLINSNQGSISQEAGNLFSGGMVPEIDNLSFISFPIAYFIFDPLGNVPPIPVNPRKDIPNSNQVISLLALTPNLSTNCGSTVTWLEPNDDCELQFSSVDEVLVLIDLADQKLQELNNSESSNNQIIVTKSLTKDLLLELSRLILEGNTEIQYDKVFLVNYFSERPEFYAKGLVPSIHIDDGNYSLARQALNQIQTSSEAEAEIEYLEIQHVYLDYLEGRFGPVSQISVNRLRVIANKHHAYSGFAFALYYLITGEKLDINYLEEVEIVPRQRSAEVIRDVSVFPNPTSDFVNLSINEAESNDYTFTLVGMNGMRMIEEVVSSNSELKVNVISVPPGIYTMRILNGNEIEIFSDRLVILK